MRAGWAVADGLAVMPRFAVTLEAVWLPSIESGMPVAKEFIWRG